MSSATDLTKAWLENLPTDVDEPTPATPVPHRLIEFQTHYARDEDDLVLSSSATSHPRQRPRSRGETNGHVKRLSSKTSTSLQPRSGVSGRGGKAMTSRSTEDEVDKAFEQLLGKFSSPRVKSEEEKILMVEIGCISSRHELEDGGKDWKGSTFPRGKPIVTKGRPGHRQLPMPGCRSQFITKQEMSAVEEPIDERNEERKETVRRLDTEVSSLRCCSASSLFRSTVKAPSNYGPQNSSTQTLTIPESNAIKSSAFRKPFRSIVAPSADCSYQSSRDFATQTFGQMATTSMSNSGAQTEISAMTQPEDVLRDSLMNFRKSVEKHSSQHSLEGARRSVASSRDKMAADDTMDNSFSKCHTNSSKSLPRDLETSQKFNNRILNESSDDSVEKWPKKDFRSARNTVAESDQLDVHNEGIPTGDTASLKSRSLSGTDNSRRLMSLMLEEVKALKSFVQTHLDERQTADRIETNQARTVQRLAEKDPDSDSAVGLSTTAKTSKKRDSARSKPRSHKSHRSRRHHSSHRRNEDEEDEEDEYHPRRPSPAREKTWDDLRRRTSLEDLKNRYLWIAEGRDQRQYLDSVYNTHSTDVSNYHRFIPATSYQTPFQPYHSQPAAPFIGFGQSSMPLPSYQAGLGNRFGYAPVNTRLVHSLPADQTFPLPVPFPSSVAVVPPVEPATYPANVRPALTFIPAGLMPTGQTIPSAQSAWGYPGQSVAKNNQTRNPDIYSGREMSMFVKRNESSTRSIYRNSSQPRKLKNSLDDALREAQEVKNLTERLGKDTQLPSSVY